MADKILPPVKAIRKFCIGCQGGSKKQVRECESNECELHSYRMGKNPNRKGKGNSEAILNLKKKISRV